MKKIAFFVEGLTEVNFLIKLIQEAYNMDSVEIEAKKIKGGSKTKMCFTAIKTISGCGEKKYFIMIYNCGGETNIKSYILNNRAGLAKADYSKIIGIRDVYPQFERSDILKLKSGLYYEMPQKDISTDFILNTMEMEAYFLAEAKHFNKINPSLDVNLIKTNLNFDPSIDDMEQRESPANDLNACYNLVGDAYCKDDSINNNIQRTLDALDYVEIYFNLPNKYQALKSLTLELDVFFNS